jgi:hypothetical protein
MITFPIYLFLLSLFLNFPSAAFAAPPPSTAIKFFIVNPANSTVGIPVTVTVEARKRNNQVDTNYQSDVTLVVSGFATGGGLVDIVNGVGTREINDSVAETVTLSLSDTEATGLDVSSTQDVIFAAAGAVSWNQQNFWFRDDDGSERTATGFGKENLAVGVPISNLNESGFNQLRTFRLRISFKAEQAAGIIAPQLEFLEYWEQADQQLPTCLSNLGWERVGTTTTSAFSLWDSPNINDQSSTTQQIAGGGPNWTSGLILDESNPSPAKTYDKNQVTEYEWSLAYNRDFSRGNIGPYFLFRISDNGTPLDTYSVCPLVSLAAPYEIKVAPTSVYISGKAYPGAEISVVEKGFRQNNLIAQGAAVSENGDFILRNVGIIQGSYAYSLIIKDKDGRQTQTKVYNVDFISESALIKDVFAPPTTGLLRSLVTKGDFLKIIGYASPKNKVRARLENGISYETNADEGGRYELLINTAPLTFGKHSLRVKQKDSATGKESDDSPTLIFIVSASTVVEADLSGDGIIDIKDWSIFLARWKEKDKSIDLNRDEKTDISDLSVFLRAFRKR